MNNLISLNQTKKHESMSKKYKFVNTSKIVQRLERQGWLITNANETRSKKYAGFQKHLIRLHNPEYSNKDFRPEIIIINGHHGTNSLKIQLGLYRFACSNGIITGVDFEKYTIRHVGYTTQKLNTAIKRLVAQVPKLYATIESMQTKQLDHAEIHKLATMAGEYKLNSAIDDSKTQKYYNIQSIIEPLRHEDTATDLFTVYNVIQEKLLKGGIEYIRVTKTDEGTTTKKMTTRAIKSIDETVKTNEFIFDAAYKVVA